jgi:hypothetical protein
LYPVLNQSCNPGINSYCSWRALYMIEHHIHVTSHGIKMMMALVFYTWPKKNLASPGFTCELFVLGKGWEEPDWIRNILFWKHFSQNGEKFSTKKKSLINGFHMFLIMFPLNFPSYVPNVFPMCSPCIPLIFIKVLSIVCSHKFLWCVLMFFPISPLFWSMLLDLSGARSLWLN